MKNLSDLKLKILRIYNHITQKSMVVKNIRLWKINCGLLDIKDFLYFFLSINCIRVGIQFKRILKFYLKSSTSLFTISRIIFFSFMPLNFYVTLKSYLIIILSNFKINFLLVICFPQIKHSIYILIYLEKNNICFKYY